MIPTSYTMKFKAAACTMAIVVLLFAIGCGNAGSNTSNNPENDNTLRSTSALAMMTSNYAMRETDSTTAKRNIDTYYEILKRNNLVVANSPAVPGDDTLLNGLYFYIDTADFRLLTADTCSGIVIQLGFVPVDNNNPYVNPHRGALRPYIRPVKNDGSGIKFMDRNNYHYTGYGCPDMCN